jgi:outer membrane protein W
MRTLKTKTFFNRIAKLALTNAVLIMAASHANADSGSAGQFVAKARVMGVLANYSKKNNVTGSATGTDSTGKYNASLVGENTYNMGNGLGFEASGSYFLTDNIAAELSAALFTKKMKVDQKGVGVLVYDSGAVGAAYYPTTQVAGTFKLIPITATISYCPLWES